MNVILKKRQLILAGLVVALGAAVFVNWYYTGGEISNPQSTTDADYVQNLGEAKYVNATETKKDVFEELKFERKKQQDESLDKLNDSLKNVSAGSEEAKTITASINALTKNQQLQTELEALVKAKIKGECLITITESGAQVVVAKGVLNDTISLQILEIVISNTDIKAENVIISEQK